MDAMDAAETLDTKVNALTEVARSRVHCTEFPLLAELVNRWFTGGLTYEQKQCLDVGNLAERARAVSMIAHLSGIFGMDGAGTAMCMDEQVHTLLDGASAGEIESDYGVAGFCQHHLPYLMEVISIDEGGRADNIFPDDAALPLRVVVAIAVKAANRHARDLWLTPWSDISRVIRADLHNFYGILRHNRSGDDESAIALALDILHASV